MMGTRAALDPVLLSNGQPKTGVGLIVAHRARGDQTTRMRTFGDTLPWPDVATSCCLVVDCPVLTTPDLALLRTHRPQAKTTILLEEHL